MLGGGGDDALDDSEVFDVSSFCRLVVLLLAGKGGGVGGRPADLSRGVSSTVVFMCSASLL